MDYEKLAEKIIEAVGGKENIDNLVHCMTRLRFSLTDEKKADDQKVKSISGVLGLTKTGGQYQVIIGNNVDKVYDEIMKKDININSNTNTEKTKTRKNIFSVFLNTISSILTPMIPGLAAAGMLRVILLILLLFNVLDKSSSTYNVLKFISDSTFYFMPILAAYSAANKFKCDRILAIVFAGVLLHPSFIKLVEGGKPITLFALPVASVKYSSSIIPSILMVWLMSYVEKFAERVSPKVIKVFFKPLLVMLITAPITLIVIGPIGNYLGQIIADTATYSYQKFGWITLAVLGASLPFIVLTGLNRAISPVSIQIFTSLGFEPLFRVAYIGSNLSQGASCLAVAVRTKNSELRQISLSAAATALLSGITEPALFGVTTKLKRPLIACSISGAIAGAYAGFVGVKAYAYATPGLLSMPMFIGPTIGNIINAIITAAIAIVGAFVLTLIIGFEDEPNDENEEVKVEHNDLIEIENGKKTKIYSPSTGKVIPLSQVNDEAFSSGACGKGIAIIPEENTIYSPVDGKVGVIFKTGHALVMVSDDGLEILIHIGINTVNLQGKYFNIKVEQGQIVTKGTPLVEIDREAILKENYDLTTCVLIQNQENLDFQDTDKKNVTKEDVIENVIMEVN